MIICTFSSTDAPPKLAAIARFLIVETIASGPNVGKGRSTWHPVVIHAPTEAEARIKAQAWWDEQVAAESAKRGKPRGGRKPKAEAAPVAVVSDADAI